MTVEELIVKLTEIVKQRPALKSSTVFISKTIVTINIEEKGQCEDVEHEDEEVTGFKIDGSRLDVSITGDE